MPFVPVPNTVMVEAIFEYDGQIVENTYYFENVDSSTDAGGITALLQLVRTTIQEELMPLLTSTIALVRLVGTLLDAVDSIGIVLSLPTPFPGGVAGEPLPNNVSYTVTFLTALRGRSFRGRNYIAGIPADGADGNQIDPTFRTGILSFYDTLRAGVSEEGWNMVVVSRVHNGAPRVTGVTTPLTGFTTYDVFLDSQRRRLPGRGR